MAMASSSLCPSAKALRLAGAERPGLVDYEAPRSPEPWKSMGFDREIIPK